MRFLLLFLAALLPRALSADTAPAPLPHAMSGAAQGTTWHILYNGPERPALQKEVEQELAAFDKVFSNYRPDSDISRFNQQNTSEWFSVDPELVKLVQLAEGVSKKSAGAFDITIGPLLRVWGFGPFKTKDHSLPNAAAIATAQKDVDYRQLLSRVQPPALRKLNPRIYVDLSGVAQGYSVDRIAALLDKKSISSYMVEIGGEIKTKGQKAPGHPWTLAIDAPTGDAGEAAAILQLQDRGLTTAGDYREYFEKDGKRFSHTIDPRDGRPVQHNLASVTVIAPMAWEADAWDTALMVLGPAEARRLLPGLNQLAVYMILHQGQGFRTESFGGFEAYFTQGSKR